MVWQKKNEKVREMKENRKTLKNFQRTKKHRFLVVSNNRE